jgi:hypothetical protein
MFEGLRPVVCFCALLGCRLAILVQGLPFGWILPLRMLNKLFLRFRGRVSTGNPRTRYIFQQNRNSIFHLHFIIHQCSTALFGVLCRLTP